MKEKIKNGTKLILEIKVETVEKIPLSLPLQKAELLILMGMDLSNVNVIGNPNKKDNIHISGEHNKVYVNNDSYSDEVHTRSKNFSSDNNRVAIGKMIPG